MDMSEFLCSCKAFNNLSRNPPSEKAGCRASRWTRQRFICTQNSSGFLSLLLSPSFLVLGDQTQGLVLVKSREPPLSSK